MIISRPIISDNTTGIRLTVHDHLTNEMRMNTHQNRFGFFFFFGFRFFRSACGLEVCE